KSTKPKFCDWLKWEIGYYNNDVIRSKLTEKGNYSFKIFLFGYIENEFDGSIVKCLFEIFDILFKFYNKFNKNNSNIPFDLIEIIRDLAITNFHNNINNEEE